MEPGVGKRSIAADDAGIHLQCTGRSDIIVYWGEIASIHALRQSLPDGSSFVEVFVDHVSGVDFVIHNVEEGYEEAIAGMEKHLMGFSRRELENVGTFEEAGKNIPLIWERNEELQPFQLQPPVVDSREPTPEERAQMEAARIASIATCEKILHRPLTMDEIRCLDVRFENGRIVGDIGKPLCDKLLEFPSDRLRDT